MKKVTTAVALLLISSLVYAGCRVYYITTPDGRTVNCMECCDSNGNCTVTCN